MIEGNDLRIISGLIKRIEIMKTLESKGITIFQR